MNYLSYYLLTSYLLILFQCEIGEHDLSLEVEVEIEWAFEIILDLEIHNNFYLLINYNENKV